MLERQWASNESVGTLDVLGARPTATSQRPGAAGARRRAPGPPVLLARRRRLGRPGRCWSSSRWSTTRSRSRSRRGDRAGGHRRRPWPRDLLTARRGSRVEVRAAERGDKRKLAELAERNARFTLDRRAPAERARSARREALADLRGAGAAGAAAADRVLRHLEPRRDLRGRLDGGLRGRGGRSAHYRSFSMRYDGGPDDFARMEEAITRRFLALAEEGDASFSATARPGGHRRRQGPAGAALKGLEAAGVTTSRWSASRSGRRRSSARAGPTRS